MASYQTFEISPGETKDIHFSVNLSGNLYLNILKENRTEGCIDLWWILWPFGSIQNIGRSCGRVDLGIPGLLSLSVASKLRAGGAESNIKILLTGDLVVANSISAWW